MDNLYARTSSVEMNLTQEDVKNIIDLLKRLNETTNSKAEHEKSQKYITMLGRVLAELS